MRKPRNSAGKRDAITPCLKTADVRIGISGWTYPPWRGVFYPKGLAHRLELHFASRQHNSIEINGSFYSLQRPSSYQHWYKETPAGFIFSVKGARFITHMKKLRNVETPLANFFGSGILALQEKLVRSYGNSRRISVGTRNALASFSSCCRKIRAPPPSSRSSMTKS